MNVSFNSDEHFKQLGEMKVPVKRAAYSDRMAWTMALLAKIAYIRFDEESNHLLERRVRILNRVFPFGSNRDSL